jgi:dihydropteroate synthase
MGIINITPESRYGGGFTRLCDEVLRRVEQMVNEGVAIIDVGGESTRPDVSTPVPLQEELDRVLPVLEVIKNRFPVLLSVDTLKPEVMQAALAVGVDIINDVNALQAPGAVEVVANSQAMVCLMHMQGEPKTMQVAPHYEDVVGEVKSFLIERMQACLAAGIAKERIIIDPGFGFGKTLAHNAHLLNHLDELQSLGVPVLVGLSRKIMIEAALNLPVEQRLYASLALAVLAITKGAAIIRTHDVKPTLEAVRMAHRVLAEA